MPDGQCRHIGRTWTSSGSVVTSASVNQVSQVAEEHLPEGVERSHSCRCNGVTRVVQRGQINALGLSLKISSSQMAILLSMVAVVRLL